MHRKLFLSLWTRPMCVLRLALEAAENLQVSTLQANVFFTPFGPWALAMWFAMIPSAKFELSEEAMPVSPSVATKKHWPQYRIFASPWTRNTCSWKNGFGFTQLGSDILS